MTNSGKPIDGLSGLAICKHCKVEDNPDLEDVGNVYCYFQIGFRRHAFSPYIAIEPVEYEEPCTLRDWERCPYNENFWR